MNRRGTQTTYDLVLSPLKKGATSHLFVYLHGRRFNFRLVQSQTGDSVVEVKDARGAKLDIKPEFVHGKN